MCVLVVILYSLEFGFVLNCCEFEYSGFIRMILFSNSDPFFWPFPPFFLFLICLSWFAFSFKTSLSFFPFSSTRISYRVFLILSQFRCST